MKPLSILSFAIASVFSAATLADTQVIHAGELLAIPGNAPLKEQTIVIVDGKISEIKKGFVSAKSIDKDATLVDLSKSFVMPGLMDMHVHLQGELGPRSDSQALRMSSQLMQMRSHMFAMKTLNAGFTTVRDVGSSSQEMYAMRDAIDKGWMQGPTLSHIKFIIQMTPVEST